MDQLLGTFFELLKNMFLTWITSPGEKDEESRKLGTVYSAKIAYSGRFAPLPCTVYLVTKYPTTNPDTIVDQWLRIGYGFFAKVTAESIGPEFCKIMMPAK